MSSIDYFLSSIQGNANKRDYVKKYVITFSFVYDILHKRHTTATQFFIMDIHFISKQIWQTTLYDT